VVADFYRYKNVPAREVLGPWGPYFSGLAGRPVRLVRADEPNGGCDIHALTLLGDVSTPELGDLLRARNSSLVVTPHDREFARVAGEVTADRIGSARRAAADLGATVLLKGNATVVADPDGRVFVNPTGTPWLATAGSGDVLSGLIASLLAAGLAPGEAAAVGAYVHGVAGQVASAIGPPTAVDVLLAVRAALHRIERLSAG